MIALRSIVGALIGPDGQPAAAGAKGDPGPGAAQCFPGPVLGGNTATTAIKRVAAAAIDLARLVKNL